jgi:hypothetical protein
MRSILALVCMAAVSTIGSAFATDAHHEHANHEHEHAKDCGHKAEKHGDHEDFVHGEHHHKKHDAHYDECDGDGPHKGAAKAKKS